MTQVFKKNSFRKNAFKINSSDLTPKQWARLQKKFPILKKFSQITFNGLLYKVIFGGNWKSLPSSFPTNNIIKGMRDELRDDGILIDLVVYLQKHSYSEDIYNKFDEHLKEEDQERLEINSISLLKGF